MIWAQRFVHPEVYPPSVAPEATRVSKGEQDFSGGCRHRLAGYTVSPRDMRIASSEGSV